MRYKKLKKKIITISTICIIILITGIYLLTRPKSLGNINGNYTEQETITSTISFSGKAGDKIKFSLESNVKEGDLEMILHDSGGREIYRLDKAKELETFYTLEKTDTYTLNAQCNNFTGKFKIKVYKVK